MRGVISHVFCKDQREGFQSVAHLVKGRLCRNQALAVPSCVLPLLGFNGGQLLGGGCHFLSQPAVGGSSRLQGLKEQQHACAPFVFLHFLLLLFRS